MGLLPRGRRNGGMDLNVLTVLQEVLLLLLVVLLLLLSLLRLELALAMMVRLRWRLLLVMVRPLLLLAVATPVVPGSVRGVRGSPAVHLTVLLLLGRRWHAMMLLGRRRDMLLMLLPPAPLLPSPVVRVRGGATQRVRLDRQPSDLAPQVADEILGLPPFLVRGGGRR